MLDCIKQWQAKDHIHCQPVNQGELINQRFNILDKCDRLFDPESPRMYLATMAGYQLYDTPLPYGGIHCVMGKIHQRWCMIIANDSRVKAGWYFPITVKKHLRAQQIAQENNIAQNQIIKIKHAAQAKFYQIKDEALYIKYSKNDKYVNMYRIHYLEHRKSKTHNIELSQCTRNS